MLGIFLEEKYCLIDFGKKIRNILLLIDCILVCWSMVHEVLARSEPPRETLTFQNVTIWRLRIGPFGNQCTFVWQLLPFQFDLQWRQVYYCIRMFVYCYMQCNQMQYTLHSVRALGLGYYCQVGPTSLTSSCCTQIQQYLALVSYISLSLKTLSWKLCQASYIYIASEMIYI